MKGNKFSWPLSCEYCRRIDMIQELETIANLSIPKDLSSEEANKYLIDACLKFDVKCPPPQTTTRLLDKVCHWYFCMFFPFYGHGSKIGFWSLFIMWFYNRFWIPKLECYLCNYVTFLYNKRRIMCQLTDLISWSRCFTVLLVKKIWMEVCWEFSSGPLNLLLIIKRLLGMVPFVWVSMNTINQRLAILSMFLGTFPFD